MFRNIPVHTTKRTHWWNFNLTTQHTIHVFQSINRFLDGTTKVSPTWLNVRVDVTYSQGQRSVGTVVTHTRGLKTWLKNHLIVVRHLVWSTSWWGWVSILIQVPGFIVPYFLIRKTNNDWSCCTRLRYEGGRVLLFILCSNRNIKKIPKMKLFVTPYVDKLFVKLKRKNLLSFLYIIDKNFLLMFRSRLYGTR